MAIIGTVPKMKAPSNSDSASSTIVDWAFGPIITRTVVGDTTYSFTNIDYSEEVTIVVYNSSSQSCSVSFPSTVMWAKGTPQSSVGEAQTNVYKFKNHGGNILATFVESQLRSPEADGNPNSTYITNVGDFFFMDPNEIEFFLARWQRITGTGSLTYDASPSSNGMGRGALKVSGTGLWRFKDYIPVMPEAGIGGMAYTRTGTGTSTVSLGFEGFDKDYNPTNIFRYFLNYNTVATTLLSYKQEVCLSEDLSTSEDRQDFFTGTRFIKPVINVTTNTDFLYLSALNFFTSNFGAKAVYTQGTQTVGGSKTFSGANTHSGTNLFTGANTFSNTITGSVSGNAGTVTNGVYTVGTQTIGGTKTFSSFIYGTIQHARYS